MVLPGLGDSLRLLRGRLSDFFGVPLDRAWTQAGGKVLRGTEGAGHWRAGHRRTHPKKHVAERVASRQALLRPMPSIQEVPSCLIPPFSHLQHWCLRCACSLLLSCASLGCPSSPCFQAREVSKCFMLKLRPRNLCPGCGKEAAAKFDLGKKYIEFPDLCSAGRETGRRPRNRLSKASLLLQGGPQGAQLGRRQGGGRVGSGPHRTWERAPRG